MSRLATAWSAFWFARADARVAARFRVLVGILTICLFASLAPLWPWPSCIALVAGATLAFGIQPQLSAGVVWLAAVYLKLAHPAVLSAADEMLRLYAFFAIFVPLGVRPHSVWPLRLVQINVASVYLVGGLAKITAGSAWLAGTALGDVMALPEWSRFADHPLPQTPLMAATFATVVFECGFPLLVWWRRVRSPVVISAFLFHAGIAILMKNLTFFSLAMMVGLTPFIGTKAKAP